MDVDTEDGSDNPWAFGTSSQYPALKAVLDDDQAMWEEFGYQLREGPSLMASTTPGMAQVALTWTAPVVTHWIPAPSVTYTLTRDDGTTRETLATDLSSTPVHRYRRDPGSDIHLPAGRLRLRRRGDAQRKGLSDSAEHVGAVGEQHRDHFGRRLCCGRND